MHAQRPFQWEEAHYQLNITKQTMVPSRYIMCTLHNSSYSTGHCLTYTVSDWLGNERDAVRARQESGHFPSLPGMSTTPFFASIGPSTHSKVGYGTILKGKKLLGQ